MIEQTRRMIVRSSNLATYAVAFRARLDDVTM